jgi:hypothetical protein
MTDTSVHFQTTASPLANTYRKYLERSQLRPAVDIPWAEFRRDQYREPALALAQAQAVKLAEGEYNSIGLFGQLASGLALSGAPFDLIAEATTIAHDELRHAAYCLRLAEACAGKSLSLPVHRAAVVELGSGLVDVEDLDFFLLKYSAVGETLAASLLETCSRLATDPVAQAVYSTLAGDEVHHARLGWHYLAWRAPQWTFAQRQRLADRIGGMVIELERMFWNGRDAAPDAVADAHALGVLDSETQRSVLDSVATEEIVPGLDALGLGASHAWAVRLLGGAS